MSIISILLLFLFFQFFRAKYKLVYIGSLACCTGVLGTSIGLYSALQAIPELGGVSKDMLANGLEGSFYYGNLWTFGLHDIDSPFVYQKLVIVQRTFLYDSWYYNIYVPFANDCTEMIFSPFLSTP